jgi:hypothetical protein
MSGKPKSGKAITLLVGTTVACVFCAVQAVSPAHSFGIALVLQQDQAKKQAPAKNGAKNEIKKGGPAGRRTLTGTVTVRGDTTFLVMDDQGGGPAGGGTASRAAGHKNWAVVNPNVLKGYEGERVEVNGRFDPEKNAIQVTNVKRLGSEKATKKSGKKD